MRLACVLLVVAGCRTHAPRATDASVTEDASLDASDDADALDAATDVDAEDAHHAELPRGGREIFPANRLVGFCGTPGAKALGRLLGNLDARAKEIQTYADQYAKGRPLSPCSSSSPCVAQAGRGPTASTGAASTTRSSTST